MAEDISPIQLKNLVRELTVVTELAALVRDWRSLNLQEGPDQRPVSDQQVLLLPGFGASDWMMEPLRRYLIARGYRTYRWGLGINNGNYKALHQGISTRMERLVQKRGEPLHVVGWSFGGYLAREVARDHPEWFHQIITLGSPVRGGAKYTLFRGYYQRKGIDLEAAAARIDARYEIPLNVPVTALFTKNDGIVRWEACIDTRSPTVSHVEVKGSHTGLVYRSDVMRLVDGCIRSFAAS